VSRFARTPRASPLRSCARLLSPPRRGTSAGFPTLASIPSLTPHPRSHDTKEGLVGLAGSINPTCCLAKLPTPTTCWLASAQANHSLCNQNLGGLSVKADVQHPFAQARRGFAPQPSLPLLTLRVSPNPRRRNSQPAHPTSSLLRGKLPAPSHEALFHEKTSEQTPHQVSCLPWF